jgi:hypothetical protein
MALSSCPEKCYWPSRRQMVRARERGNGRERGATINWPSVCLTPADSHGSGLSCVPHASTGVHNMSDVSMQAIVSFIITLRSSAGSDLLRCACAYC